VVAKHLSKKNKTSVVQFNKTIVDAETDGSTDDEEDHSEP